MFTGIIEAVGSIRAVQDLGGDKRLTIATGDLDLSAVKLGDSIASNGVCLTVVELSGDAFSADVSNETLAHSTFAQAVAGMAVNLERAMPANGRFDGHIVSGHVDGVGELLSCQRDARSIRLKVALPEALARYAAVKGSICIDGVSLTINEVFAESGRQGVLLNIVPHTADRTRIAAYRPGILVNLEVDIIARYLERLLQAGETVKPSLSKSFLAEHGFLKGRSRV